MMQSAAMSSAQQLGIVGIDAYSAPHQIDAHHAQQLDGVMVVAGELWTRPGKQGILNTPFGAPINYMIEYVDSAFNTWLLFSTGGKLYICPATGGTAATTTEILRTDAGYTGQSFSLNASGVRIIRVGIYAYIIDGVGPLYRVYLPGSAPTSAYSATLVTGLNAPTSSIIAALTNQVIDAANDSTKWDTPPALNYTPFPASGTTGGGMISNPLFSGASGSSTSPPPTGWQTGGDSMDFRSGGGNPNAAYFDPGAAPSWVDWETPNATYSTTTATYSDLVLVVGQGGLKVSSASRPFISTDIGSTLQVTGGSGFAPNVYAITAVTGGVATLSLSAGTAGSTGGKATLTAPNNTINNARVFWLSASMQGTGNVGNMDAALIPESHLTSSSAVVKVSDLVIGGTATQISSASYSFQSADVGKVVTITAGTGFTVGGYTIISVSGGVATLNAAAGTASSTGGTAQLGLDASATSWGNHNVSLQTPPSAISGGSVDIPLNSVPNTLSSTNQVFSLTGLPSDPDYIRFRWQGPANQPGTTYLVSTSLTPVDARLLVANAPGGTGLLLSANNPSSTKGYGFNCLGGSWIRRNYAAVLQTYSDLVISGTSTSVVTSAAHPFTVADVGKTLVITGGTGFNIVAPKILSVDGSNRATLSAAAGALSSTGGAATAQQPADFSTSSVISIPYSAPAPSGQIPFRIGFQQAGAPITAISWSNHVTYTSDGTAFYVDVSTIAAAIRAQTAYLYIQVTADLPATISPTNICTLGAISTSGNLPIHQAYGGYAGDITYQFTEVNASADPSFSYTDMVIQANTTQVSSVGRPFVAGDVGKTLVITGGTGFIASRPSVLSVTGGVATLSASAGTAASTGGVGALQTNFVNVIESDPCAVSNALQPDGVHDQALLPLPSPLNPSTTHYFIYRTGGTFADGLGRLVAQVSLTADQAADAAHTYTWTSATRTFVDNTSDLALGTSVVTFLLLGRQPAPVGATAIAYWQNRLVLATGNTINISWLNLPGQNDALYFNSINVSDPNDVAQSIKGAQFVTGQVGDNDPVVALAPLAGQLVIIKSRSVSLAIGTSAAQLAVSDHLQAAGVGGVGGNAWAIVRERLWFLGPDGVWAYWGGMGPMGETAQRVSREIEPLLNPKIRNLPPIPASAYKGAYMHYQGERIYLFAPGSATDNNNTTCYVFDEREGGWVRWPGMNIVCAASLSQQVHTNDMYLGGADGQIYFLGGNGDKATPSSTPAAVSCTVKTRAMGQEIGGDSYWRSNRPQYILLDVTTQEQTTFTYTSSAKGSAPSYQASYTFQGTGLFKFELGQEVEGSNHSYTLSWATVLPFVLTSIASQYVEAELGNN